MVTKAELPEEPEDIADKVEGAVRSAIAGHPQGAVRRIALYLSAYIAILVTYAAPPIASFAALAVALVALTLLATTDQLA